MAYGDTASDETLARAWAEFCDTLKGAGEILFRDSAPATPLDRAVGFRFLSRSIPLALGFELENADPLFPDLMRYFEPTRKQGGDNPDALYLGAPIDGSSSYRLSGNRGSAHFLAFTSMRPTPGPWGSEVVDTLFGHQLQTEADGSFELHVGPDEKSGNWLRTAPDCFRLTIRQFFNDWNREDPMTVSLERLDAEGPPPLLTPDGVADGLRRAGEWVASSARYWADAIDVWQARPNEFLPWRALESGKTDATPGGVPLVCYWTVEPDEVLLIEVTPPDAHFWNIEFGNYRFETMDYRYRMSSINSHQGVLEEDGSLRVAVCHDDPGLPNWLDPSGHREGYATFRWMHADAEPVPACRKLRRADLEAALPADVRRISAEERREALRRRKQGIERRFRA